MDKLKDNEEELLRRIMRSPVSKHLRIRVRPVTARERMTAKALNYLGFIKLIESGNPLVCQLTNMGAMYATQHFEEFK